MYPFFAESFAIFSLISSSMALHSAPRYYISCIEDGDVQGITMVVYDYYWNNALAYTTRMPGVCSTTPPNISGYTVGTKRTTARWAIKKN